MWGKTSTHLVSRSVRSEVVSVKVKETHGEERPSREELGFFPTQKEKAEFSS